MTSNILITPQGVSRSPAYKPDHILHWRAPPVWSLGTSNPKLDSATFSLLPAHQVKPTLFLPVAAPVSVNGTSTPSLILILTLVHHQGQPMCPWFYPYPSSLITASVDLDFFFLSSLLTHSNEIYVPLQLILQIVAGCFRWYIWLGHTLLKSIQQLTYFHKCFIPWVTHRSQDS